MAKKVTKPVLSGSFNDDYDYYVKLPITGYEAHVRGLLVKEEALLRAGQTKPSYVYETTIKIIYDCTRFIDNIGEDGEQKKLFPTFQSFMEGMCSADRDALLWAIINKSYGEKDILSNVSFPIYEKCVIMLYNCDFISRRNSWESKLCLKK